MNFTYNGRVYTDVLPANYVQMHIPAAWKRSQGQGITVASIDTGVDPAQQELNALFATGAVSGRSYIYDATDSYLGNPIWKDQCGHGTHQASVIAAPMNDNNMVGVAWGANLVAIRHHGDILNVWDVSNTKAAIDKAVGYGARIVSMAFGAQNIWSNTIADAIRYHYARGVLFVGAAGSVSEINPTNPFDRCWTPTGVIFPAQMPQVIAVTGLDSRGFVACGVFQGPNVDIGAVVDQVASGAPSLGEGDWGSSGKSSNATAIVTGTAALIWSQSPYLTNVEVHDRVLWAGDRSSALDGQVTWGKIDALAAVGGFAKVTTTGPGTVERQYEPVTYRLTAVPHGGTGPFTYLWQDLTTGTVLSTSSTLEVTFLPEDYPEGSRYAYRTYNVTVTDQFDGVARTAPGGFRIQDSSTPDPCKPAVCPPERT